MTAPAHATTAPAAASGRQVAKGAAWMLLFKLVDKGFGLVSTLVLARLLVPQDFGLVAMASAVVALTQLMAAFGFDTAIIQRQDATRAHMDTAWTFNVLFGAAIALVLLALALPAAVFYQEPRLTQILPVLALASLLGGFQNIGIVLFRKQLDFRSEFRYSLAKRIPPFAMTITWALVAPGYWALVAGMVFGSFMSTLLSFAMHPYRPRFSLAARGDLMHFSKWLLLSSLVGFLHQRSTDFILGRTVGGHGLAIYNISVELSALPATELIAPINRAAYPVYAQLAGDRGLLLQRFTEVFAAIGFLALPLSVGMFCLAEQLVLVLLGERWIEAVPFIRILALSGLCGALQSNLYLLLVAMGRPKANTVLSGLLLLVSLPAVVGCSLRWGALGAAWAHGVVAVVGLLGILAMFRHHTGASWLQVCRPLGRPAVASAGMAFVLGALLQQLPAAASLQLQGAMLAGSAAIGGLTYVTLALLLWKAGGGGRGTEAALLDAMRRAGRRLRPIRPSKA